MERLTQVFDSKTRHQLLIGRVGLEVFSRPGKGKIMQEASKKEVVKIGIAMVAGSLSLLILHTAGVGHYAEYLKPVGTVFISLPLK